MKDPIIEEVRKIRRLYAASYKYNIHDIVKDIRKKQKTSKNRVLRVTKTKKRSL